MSNNILKFYNHVRFFKFNNVSVRLVNGTVCFIKGGTVKSGLFCRTEEAVVELRGESGFSNQFLCHICKMPKLFLQEEYCMF